MGAGDAGRSRDLVRGRGVRGAAVLGAGECRSGDGALQRQADGGELSRDLAVTLRIE